MHINCKICEANGETTPAEFLAGQSIDQGETVVAVAICAAHAKGWNDDGDWNAPVVPLRRDLFQLPEGATSKDERWQTGYHDGCEDNDPTNLDAVYLSGWCHGFCGGVQCSAAEAEAECRTRLTI